MSYIKHQKRGRNQNYILKSIILKYKLNTEINTKNAKNKRSQYERVTYYTIYLTLYKRQEIV